MQIYPFPACFLLPLTALGFHFLFSSCFLQIFVLLLYCYFLLFWWFYSTLLLQSAFFFLSSLIFFLLICSSPISLLTTQDKLFLLFHLSVDGNLKGVEYYESFLFYLLCFCVLMQYSTCKKELQMAVFHFYAKCWFFFFYLSWTLVHKLVDPKISILTSDQP